MCLIYDAYTILFNKKPSSWKEFYNGGKIFTWYSGFFYFDKFYLINFIFFLIFSKTILLIQIVIGFDLLILKIFINKIKRVDNFIYITFITIPWIYINLFLLKVKKKEIKTKDIKLLLKNFIFINLWLCSKFVVENSLILTNNWKNWKKHSFYPRFKFLKFLKIIQKEEFNEINLLYFKKFTY